MNFKNILSIILLIFTISCSSNQDQKPSVEELYNNALKQLKKGNFYTAQDKLDEIESEYPYSEFADKAEILKAFIYYLDTDYEKSLVSTEAFIKLRPANQYTPYMQFLKAQSYLLSSSDFLREQNRSWQALNNFNIITTRYKNSKYYDYSIKKITEINNVIAHYHLNIGRIQQEKQEYIAAIRQFNMVIKTLPKNKFIPESHFRIIESYYAMGLNKQAKYESEQLNKKYPDTIWNKYNLSLISKKDS